ncbi:MAG: DEAD/DEAH box helicase, partial [Nannocystaceae bacterium]
MLQHSPGFPRARSLLTEADLSGLGRASSAAGKPDVFSNVDSHSPSQVGGRGAGGLAGIEAALAQTPGVEVVSLQRTPAQPGAHGEWPAPLDSRLQHSLGKRGIERPYLHQAQALQAIAEGKDVVLATSTASGKSLCYQVPIVSAVCGDPRARALMLFPTKALGRDQVRGLRELAGDKVGAAVYDGDTPPGQRRAARARAHAVATNPDMLHRGLLPHHDRWGAFLANLRYVVIDELHTYRGVFGSHVANILRRLWRVCRHHGSQPQIIACSATIANPRELACEVSGRDNWEVIDRNTAPAGARTFVIVNPEVVDPITGVRGDYLKATRRVASLFRRAQVSTLTFCRTRKAVELLTRYLREDEAGVVPDAEGRGVDAAAVARAQVAVRGYRGGYLPERRREVEQALVSGDARMVVTTHALELGIDIGGLDAVVLAGYPGTRAATVQRSGRAGRRASSALTVLVLSSRPLDQVVAADPEFLLGRPPEHARVDPLNPEIFVPHLRCAAHELPIAADEDCVGVAREELEPALDYLAEAGVLRRESSEGQASMYFSIGAGFPADSVDIRGALEENYTVVE